MRLTVYEGVMVLLKVGLDVNALAVVVMVRVGVVGV